MVKKCCVPHCRSGYKTGFYCTQFTFPNNPELRAKWLEAINRPNYEITSNSFLCERHFESRFIRITLSGRRKLTWALNPIPTIFPKDTLQTRRLSTSTVMNRKPGNELELPAGWIREEKRIWEGMLAGRTQIAYVSPDGTRYTRKSMLQRALIHLDLANFEFNAGKFLKGDAKRFKQKQRELTRDGISFPRRNYMGPSQLKRKATHYYDHEAEVKMNQAKVTRRRPRQIFWEKRLQGKRATVLNVVDDKPFTLPSPLSSIMPSIPDDTVLSSVVACLHNSDQVVVGQHANHVVAIQSNPAVWLNTNQPLFKKVMISEDDIRKQEAKVKKIRQLLQDTEAAYDRSQRVKTC